MNKKILHTRLKGSTKCKGQTFLSSLNNQNDKETFTLEREYDNLYDYNAIKVVGSINKGSYGYIRRDDASIIAPLIDSGYKAKVASYSLDGGLPYWGLALTIVIATTKADNDDECEYDDPYILYDPYESFEEGDR